MQKILFGVLVFVSVTGYAQKGTFGGSINLGASIPQNKNLNTGLGGVLNFYYMATNTGSIQLNYTNVNNGIKNLSTSSIIRTNILSAGYQQYFSHKKNWWISGEAGFSVSKKFSTPAFAVGFGYTINTKIGGIDVGVKQFYLPNSGSNNLFVLPTIGCKFTLGKRKSK
jgi:hypothetical protein